MRSRRTVLVPAAEARASLHEISRNCRYRMLIPTPQQTTFNQEKSANEREAFLTREGPPPGIAISRVPSTLMPVRARTSRGGIAQLVERQLCKLEVRGSNPLASSLHLARHTWRAATRQAKPRMNSFCYVYILQSTVDAERRQTRTLFQILFRPGVHQEASLDYGMH